MKTGVALLLPFAAIAFACSPVVREPDPAGRTNIPVRLAGRAPASNGPARIDDALSKLTRAQARNELLTETREALVTKPLPKVEIDKIPVRAVKVEIEIETAKASLPNLQPDRVAVTDEDPCDTVAALGPGARPCAPRP